MSSVAAAQREFVTRKITLAIANIVAGKQDKISLGNMNTKA